MTSVLVGTVKSSELSGIIVSDHVTGKEVTCKITGDDSLDIEIGETAIFVGTVLDSVFYARKVEIRKFLEPLYEKDLYEISGQYTIISVVDNPFAEVYRDLTQSS